MHSFDVDMGERFSIHESDWFEHGNNPLTFETGTFIQVERSSVLPL